ncbi:hypothetical protein D3C76_1232900 [compost metagenome]
MLLNVANRSVDHPARLLLVKGRFHDRRYHSFRPMLVLEQAAYTGRCPIHEWFNAPGVDSLNLQKVIDNLQGILMQGIQMPSLKPLADFQSGGQAMDKPDGGLPISA